MKPRLLSVIVLTIGLLCINTFQAQENLTPKQWQDDLKYLQSTVHKDFPFLFKKVSAKVFDDSVAKLHQEISLLEPHEVPVAFSRIVSLFEYGHTQIPFSTVAKSGVLPLNLYHFNDGVYIEGVTKKYQNTLGARVVAIEGVPVEKALELIRPVVPVENESYFKAYGIRFLTVPDVLHAQKVISKRSDNITLSLEKEGKIVKHTFEKIALKDLSRDYNLTIPNTQWLSVRNQDKTPLYLKKLNEKFYFFEYLPDNKTLYVRQSSVFNDKDESLKDFYKRLFAFIDTNAVDKLIYDVRLNGGGNNYNNMPLIKGLMARPDINKKGHLFYIIGRNTFSACQNLTNEITRYTEAILVGEPTSENVNFYGDNRKVTLPNSKINAYLSFAWWQDVPQWENKEASLPYIAADMSFNQYRTNEDPVLDVALNYSDNDFVINPMDHLTNLFIAGEFDTLKKDAAKIVKDTRYKYYNFNEEFTKTANHLLRNGQTEGGLFILQLITELNPKSTSALYALAGALDNSNSVDKAIAAYQKIIDMAPNSDLSKASKNRIKALQKN